MTCLDVSFGGRPRLASPGAGAEGGGPGASGAVGRLCMVWARDSEGVPGGDGRGPSVWAVRPSCPGRGGSAEMREAPGSGCAHDWAASQTPCVR